MKSIRKTVSAPAAVMIAVLCIVIAYQAGASRPTPSARPAVVATVNLPKVLEGLAQRSHAEATLEAMHADLRQDHERIERTVQQLQADFEALHERHRAGEDVEAQLQDIADRIDQQRITFLARRQFAVDKFDLEHALLMQDIYRNIKNTVRDMAQAEGYDLVLFDTSQGELHINPEARQSRTDQVQQQILSRGVLYSGSHMDVTNDLIEKMNNQFRAGQLAR